MCFRSMKKAGSVARWLLLGASMMLVAGCGAGGGAGGGNPAAKDFKIDLPTQLVHHQVPGGALVAEAHLENGSVFDLYVDPATGAIWDSLRHSGTALALDIVFLIDDGVNRTEVGRATVNLNWTDPLLAEAALSASDVQFSNSDQDGFTDLMELALGSDHTDSASHPKVGNRRTAFSYVVVDAMGSINGSESTVSGDRASTNYGLN